MHPTMRSCLSLRSGRALTLAQRMRRNLNIAVFATSVVIAALFTFGVVTSTTVPFGTSPVSFRSAVTSLQAFSLQTSPGFSWFLPIAVVLLATFLLSRSKRIRIPAVVVSCLLPLVFLDPSRAIAQFLYLPFIAISTTIGMFAGTLDGETWAEGFIAFAAMGWWSVLWFVVFFWEMRRANQASEAIGAGAPQPQG